MISEFELIRRYFTHRTAHTVLGVGDDAALVNVGRDRELVISSDMLVEGRHFLKRTDPYRLGHKALAVNLSDLAAMGALPRWATLALALPRADPDWIAKFSRGFMALARRHGVDLIGGDTTRGPLTICVQIMGVGPQGLALRRDGAKAGDDIWLSGTLGDAALALAGLRRRIRLDASDLRRCRARLEQPQPRVVLGQALRAIAHSAIDISDGLVADLGHILERSRVAAEIEWARLPRSATLQRYIAHAAARDAVLAGGDDYELCFTAPAAARARVTAVARRLALRLTRVGTIVRLRARTPRLRVIAADGSYFATLPQGYDHFR